MSVAIFCCYARKDQQLLDELKTHLKPLQRRGLISIWNDTDISPGANWEVEIHKHLDAAQVILLLVSPDFINSEYSYSIEMDRAMKLYEQGKAYVIPVILRPTDWEYTPFSKLQVLPKEGKPLTTWNNHDEAFLNVAKGIRKVIEEFTPPLSTNEQLSKPRFR
jgi:TIR domain